MSKIISVVMPCLNVVKYIEKCVQSVLAQTLSNIEILVVDAGSTDGTLEILDQYCKKDDRIQVIHSDVKSYGYQVNLGIAKATGEYIAIIETDDIVEVDMLEVLYCFAKEQNVDYVKGTARAFWAVDDFSYTNEIWPLKKNDDRWGEKIIPKETPDLFISDNYLWNGIYRRDFLKNIQFHETPGAAYQDISALFQIFSKANSAIYVKSHVYNYRKDNESASSYNKNSFRFLNVEYKLVWDKYLNHEKTEWVTAYFEKMYSLCEAIFRLMVATGDYWESEEAEIMIIRHKLREAAEKGVVFHYTFSESLMERLGEFLENPRYLYTQLYDEFNARKKAMHNILSATKAKNVVIFGCGQTGKFVYSILKRRGNANSIDLCDNNEIIRNSPILGRPVMSVDDACEKNSDSCFVICSKGNYEEMKCQLQISGIKEENIYSYAQPIDVKLFIY